MTLDGPFTLAVTLTMNATGTEEHARKLVAKILSELDLTVLPTSLTSATATWNDPGFDGTAVATSMVIL